MLVLASIHTYEQREQATITALREYFTLGGCAGPGRPIHTYEQREQATITSFDTHDSFERIFHFGRVCWSWQANTHIRAERASHLSNHDKNSFERIFHFGRVCWSWQANTHIRAERASHNNIFRHSRHETNAIYV